jgi:hypothetical protein
MATVCSDYLEDNSQTFKKGELVKSATTGAINTCDANPVVQILGIAQLDATNVTSGNITMPVEVINPYDIYLMRVSNAGTAALCTTLSLFTKYGITLASNLWTVDNQENDEDVVTVVGYHYDANGSADYWAYVRFLPAVCQAYTGV